MRQSDTFAAARRAVPLPQLWGQAGKPLTRQGSRFSTSFTPCCGEATRKDAGSLFLTSAGEWRWKCFRCGKGGSAVDFVAAMESLTSIDAAKRLLAMGGGFTTIMGRAPAPVRERVAPEARLKALREVMAAVRGIGHFPKQVRTYLHDERGIPDGVIDEAVARGLLRGLPCPPDAADVWLRLNTEPEDLLASKILRAGAKRAAAAYKPLVFLSHGGMEFRAIRPVPECAPKALQYGVEAWPLAWKPRGEVRTILTVEGGIDLLSVVALGFGQDTLVLGMLGAAAWQEGKIRAIADKYPNAAWQVGFDGDGAGDASGGKLLTALAEMKIHAERITPWGGGKDWNDTLLAAKAF